LEKPVRFGESGEEMFGVLHIPECKTSYPKPAVIFCHGFKGDKVGPHRLFVKMARRLAKNGILVFRFDYRGCGESLGRFVDTTISSQIDDTLTAINFVSQLKRVNSSQLGLLGLSLGGAVASCAAARSKQIKALVLWSAVADIQKVFLSQRPEDGSLEQINEKGYIDLEGFRLGKEFVMEVNQINPLTEIKEYKDLVFLAHGSEDEVVPIENIESYYDTVITKKCQKHIVVGADHTYNSYEWEKEVMEKTQQWLIENL